jgi:hypothetical protein
MLTVRSLCLGMAVLLAACAGDGLERLDVPKEGVRLGYDLQAGATYDGHLKIGTTREVTGLKEHLNQNVEFDAKLLVLGRDAEHDGTVVAARFSAIDLDWGVAPEVALSRDEFIKLAGEQLRGLEMRFVVSPRGKLLQRPEPADTLAEPMFELYDVLSAAVAASFVELPDRGLRPGDTWTETGDEQRVDATFEGMFAGQGEGNLARLQLVFDAKRKVQTESGERRAETQGTARGMFSTAGFFAALDVEARDFDPRVGMGVRQMSARWRKTGVGRADATSVQAITDPCDPDYVGELPCATQAEPPTPEPEADTAVPEPEAPEETSETAPAETPEGETPETDDVSE